MNNLESVEINIVINDNCIECGKCVEVCPLGILTYKTINPVLKRPVIFDPRACICCGHCTAVCSKDAISHNQLPLDEFKKIDSSYSIGWKDFVKFTRQKRSIRKFLDRQIPEEIIDKILDESTRYAPTGHNRQSTDIIIIKGKKLKEIKEELNKAVELLYYLLNILHFFSKNLEYHWRYVRSCRHMIELGMDPYTRYAPMALLFTSDKCIKESEVDAAILSYQTVISAELLGLKSCYFGALINSLPYSKKLRNLISLPAHKKITCGILLGYSDVKYNKEIYRKKLNRL